jgi:hypothetical protein
MKMLIAAATLLMLPATALSQSAPAKTAPASEPMTVYDKALSPGWENWSWAKTELSADIGSARMPIMVDAQGYGGMFLHHAPFSTAPYKTLNLLIQVVGGPAQVRVIATANGKGIPDGDKMEGGQPVTKMKLVKLAPGGWTQVQVPLVNLGAENATIDGLMVMNDSGEPAPHIYVADIAFKP